MPLYDYQCVECGAVREVFRSLSELEDFGTNLKMDCPQCDSYWMRRMITVNVSIYGDDARGRIREGYRKEDAAIKHAKRKGEELRSQGKMGPSEKGDFFTLNDVRKGKVPD